MILGWRRCIRACCGGRRGWCMGGLGLFLVVMVVGVGGIIGWVEEEEEGGEGEEEEGGNGRRGHSNSKEGQNRIRQKVRPCHLNEWGRMVGLGGKKERATQILKRNT